MQIFVSALPLVRGGVNTGLRERDADAGGGRFDMGGTTTQARGDNEAGEKDRGGVDVDVALSPAIAIARCGSDRSADTARGRALLGNEGSAEPRWTFWRRQMTAIYLWEG